MSELLTVTDYNLGALIRDLESLDQDLPIFYEHDSDWITRLVPTQFCSWRGYYAYLGLLYKITSISKARTTVKDILDKAKWAAGQTYRGWKGGDFIMSESTPIFCIENESSGLHTKKYERISITGEWQVSGIEIGKKWNGKDEADVALIKTTLFRGPGDLADLTRQLKHLTKK